MLKRVFKTRREVALGLLTLVLVVLLVAKSTWLDPKLGALDADQQAFQIAIERTLEVNYRSQWGYKYGLMAIRLVDIQPATDSEVSEAEKLGKPLVHPYTAKLRKYLLGILPVGELKLMQ